MNKTNIKCPRCHSDQLYKFGLDKQANQKYQCKNCKRQFVPDSVSTRPKCNYPRCPECGDKKYNHIIVEHHNFNIDDSSSNKLIGASSIKGMRFPLHIIITTLTLYF